MSKTAATDATTKPKTVTVAFANPSIHVKAKGRKGSADYREARTIRAPKGWPITDNEKYPMSKFETMLVDEAKRQGGSCRVNMEVNIQLNMKTDETLSADGVEFIS